MSRPRRPLTSPRRVAASRTASIAESTASGSDLSLTSSLCSDRSGTAAPELAGRHMTDLVGELLSAKTVSPCRWRIRCFLVESGQKISRGFLSEFGVVHGFSNSTR